MTITMTTTTTTIIIIMIIMITHNLLKSRVSDNLILQYVKMIRQNKLILHKQKQQHCF